MAFDVYLAHCPSTAYVDHAALVWLLRSNRELHNDKVRKWVERLQTYTIDIIHRPARDHIVPDTMSRILWNAPPVHPPGTFDVWPVSALPSLLGGGIRGTLSLL